MWMVILSNVPRGTSYHWLSPNQTHFCVVEFFCQMHTHTYTHVHTSNYCPPFSPGVFGDSSGLNSVSVMEGGSVVLHTSVTKQQCDKMLWYFNDTRIAQINGQVDTSCLYDGEDGRFRDRVKVDYETGSLIITNIRSEHAGRYEAELIQSKSSGTSISLNRTSKCDSTKITRKMSNIGDTIKTFIVSVNCESLNHFPAALWAYEIV